MDGRNTHRRSSSQGWQRIPANLTTGDRMCVSVINIEEGEEGPEVARIHGSSLGQLMAEMKKRAAQMEQLQAQKSALWRAKPRKVMSRKASSWTCGKEGYTREKEAKAEKQVQDLLKKGMIKPAGGVWSSPVVLVKKEDGKWHFYINYRRLNAVTSGKHIHIPASMRTWTFLQKADIAALWA